MAVHFSSGVGHRPWGGRKAATLHRQNAHSSRSLPNPPPLALLAPAPPLAFAGAPNVGFAPDPALPQKSSSSDSDTLSSETNRVARLAAAPAGAFPFAALRAWLDAGSGGILGIDGDVARAPAVAAAGAVGVTGGPAARRREADAGDRPVVGGCAELGGTGDTGCALAVELRLAALGDGSSQMSSPRPPPALLAGTGAAGAGGGDERRAAAAACSFNFRASDRACAASSSARALASSTLWYALRISSTSESCRCC
jgi:hypothetical protein